MPKFSISLTAQKQIKEIIAYYLENETKERADKILDSFYEMFHFTAQNPYSLPKADEVLPIATLEKELFIIPIFLGIKSLKIISELQEFIMVKESCKTYKVSKNLIGLWLN
jgi:plasmid stabilization system protein ParE